MDQRDCRYWVLADCEGMRPQSPPRRISLSDGGSVIPRMTDEDQSQAQH